MYSSVWTFKPIGAAALVALTIIQSGCATTVGAPLDGVVTDATTGRPIPGAFAIAMTRPKGSDSTCTHVDVARADSEGRYSLSRWNTAFGDRTVTGYAPGYDNPVDPSDSPKLRLVPYKGTADNRLSYFARYDSLVHCGDIDAIAPKLRELYAAIDDEDRSLPLSRARLAPAGVRGSKLRALEERKIQEEKRREQAARDGR